MYPYNYNTQGYSNSIYTPASTYATSNINNDDRLIGSGIVAPLLLGGVAGYAIGQNNWNNNRPYMFYTQPFYSPYYNPYFYGRRW